jgi:hypothetical protein
MAMIISMQWHESVISISIMAIIMAASIIMASMAGVHGRRHGNQWRNIRTSIMAYHGVMASK